MFTTATLNRNGQIVIPSKIRKKYHIHSQATVKITPKKSGFLIELICEENKDIEEIMEKTTITFPKSKKSKIFSFEPKNPKVNLSDKVDEIVYL